MICSPFFRVVVGGWFFWRRFCPLDGLHRHFHCRECHANWIFIEPVKNIHEV